MKCIRCNSEMVIEELRDDNPYISEEKLVCTSCECTCTANYSGLSDEPSSLDWFDERYNEIIV